MTAKPPSSAERPKAPLFLLIAITALAPVSLQIFIPALPAIQASFGTETGVTQLALSLSIFANAIATLAYGPLSDRFGRRPVILAGLVIFIVGSVMSATASTINALIVARIVQSSGAAAGMVLARAIIRDLYDREQAASAIAYLTMAMVVAPMIAPTFGAILIDQLDWRAIFVALTGVGALLTLYVWQCLMETHVIRHGLASPGLLRGASLLIKEPAFVAYMLQSTFAISTFFAFISGAPYFMIDVLDRSATEYGLLFMVVSGGFMIGNLASAKLGSRVGIDRLIWIGSILALAANVLTLFLMVFAVWTPLILFGPMMVTGFANGLSIANAQAGAISINPELAGTASGVTGFCQMFIAALVSQSVGTLQNGTPYPMIIFMTSCALLSLVCFGLGHRRQTPTI